MNRLLDDGAKAMALNTTLKSLNLSMNSICDDGASALALNTSLESLGLSGNHIGNEGANNLAKNKTLNSLDVSSNDIGDEGAMALAVNDTLKTLNVCGNVSIRNTGVNALAANITLKFLYVIGKLDLKLSNHLIVERRKKILNEENPYLRAQNAINAGVKPENVPVPFLKTLCLFKIKNSPEINTEKLPVELKEALQNPKI